jgi:uncharacterized protein DUF2190
MANNKVLERYSPLTIAVPSAAAVTSNQPLLFGTIACVANESDPPSPTMASTGNVSVDTEGAFNLTVTADSGLSPVVTSAVKVGDKIYARFGTVDATTGVTYGFTLSKDSAGVFFGVAIAVGGGSATLLAAGTTGTIAVLLKNGASS